MNETIFFFFYNLAHQSTFFDSIIIFFGVVFPFLVLVGVGFFLLWKSEILKLGNFTLINFYILFKKGIVVFGTAFIAYLFATILKELISADRSFVRLDTIIPLFNPTQEYSFPSTHAAIFSALAIAVYFRDKKIGIIFLISALLIGLARIIAGVHFPIDILGGFILGSGVTYLVAYFVKNV
ncbi:phosphatase PAP2 family protein [Candidatus Nomurabacteria bacterium]|nr:phosphatase PAP2 family protein [Candidatus Nomurabacteria bacterium]